MTGVRIRDGEFEGQCDYCHEYLPLTTEFWYPPHGVRRCRACWREYHRLHQQGYRGSLRQALWRANNRVRYRLLPFEEKERRRARTRQWKAEHREHIAEYNRAYRERRRAA